MGLREFLGSGKGLQKLKGHPHLPHILSATELEFEVARENYRAIRHGRVFSLVVFISRVDHQTQIARLAEIVHDSKRITDVLGRMDSTRAAVLLPETGGQDAWVFTERVLEQLAEARLRFDSEVYAYPHEGVAGQHTPRMSAGMSDV